MHYTNTCFPKRKINVNNCRAKEKLKYRPDCRSLILRRTLSKVWSVFTYISIESSILAAGNCPIRSGTNSAALRAILECVHNGPSRVPRVMTHIALAGYLHYLHYLQSAVLCISHAPLIMQLCAVCQSTQVWFIIGIILLWIASKLEYLEMLSTIVLMFSNNFLDMLIMTER